MKIILLALAATSLAPAPARNAAASQAAARAPSAQQVDAEMAAYGRWLARLQAVMTPVERELAGLSASWQQALQSGGPEAAARAMRTVVARVLAEVDRSEAELGRLEPFVLRHLELPADLAPDAMVRHTRELHARIRPAVQSFVPVLEAIARNDESAGTAAFGRTMDSMALVLDSQMLMMRAVMASTGREDPSWHEMNVRLLFTQAAARTVSAFPRNLAPRRDPSFPAELRRIAGQLDTSAREGSATLDRYLSDVRPAASNGQSGALARRAHAVLEAARPVFPLASQMAQLLRANAELGDEVSIPRLQRLMTGLRELKTRLDGIGLETQAALARQY